MSTATASPPGLPNARVALYNLVQDRLTKARGGQSLADFILERRQAGQSTPYRHIAAELVEITGIDITHEAVRRWYHKAVEALVESGAVGARGSAGLAARFTS